MAVLDIDTSRSAGIMSSTRCVVESVTISTEGPPHSLSAVIVLVFLSCCSTLHMYMCQQFGTQKAHDCAHRLSRKLIAASDLSPTAAFTYEQETNFELQLVFERCGFVNYNNVLHSYIEETARN